jgi:superfamily II DNA or RNA helicase
MLTLRPYQKAARKAVRAAVKAGKRKVIVRHATGTGKTVLFARIIRKRGGRALILAHRTELIQQAAAKLKDVGLSCGIVQAEANELKHDIVVASVQSLVGRLEGLCNADPRPFKTVVVDECHHAYAKTYQTILDAVVTPTTLLLGVSATPFRTDESEGLGDIFDEIVHSYDIQQGIDDGYLCPIIAKTVHLQGADFSKLKKAHGDITEASAAKVLHDAKAPAQIAKAVKQFASDRSTLIFAPTIDIGIEIENACKSFGMLCSSVYGHTPAYLRAEILDQFRDGTISTLINCGVLTEGYDEPRVSCIAMARLTTSKTLFTQIIGRGTRPHPDKENLLVLDFAGATLRHDLMSVGKLLPKTVVKLTHPSGSWKDKAETPFDWYDWTKKIGHAPEGDLVTTDVSLFSSRPLAWIKTNFGYVLDAGKEHGMVCMSSKGGNWAVFVLKGDNITPQWAGASFGYAQAFAEAWIKTAGAMGLCKRDASWRLAPITEGQSKYLTNRKIPHTAAWNKGRASDAITRNIAEYLFKKAYE